MSSNVGSKRNREIESDVADERVTKKLKCNECDIHVLPEELLMQILVRVPKKNIGTLSEVSPQWLQITRSRSFWKTSCQLKWTNMIATDTLDFNREVYLVPTVIFNGKTLVDWQFYYKLRTKFSKATQAITKYISAQESFHGDTSKEMKEIASMGNELQHSPISKFLDLIPALSLRVDRTEFATFAVPVLDVLCDIALLHYTRDELDSYKHTLIMLSHLIQSKKPRVKMFYICRRIFDLCQLDRVGKQPYTLLSLVLTLIRLFKAMTPFDEQTKKLFTWFTEYLIQLGPLDIGDYDEKRQLVFRYPFSGQELPSQITMKKFQEIKELTIPIEVATRLYRTSKDWKVKASAVAVGLRLYDLTPEYIENYCTMALHAGKQNERLLAFSGIVGLYELLKEADETVMKSIKTEHAAEMFELFTDALTRYDSTLGLSFYQTLVHILHKTALQSDWISDEVLDRSITNVLNMLAQLDPNVPNPQQDPWVYGLSVFGELFKRRIVDKLNRMRTVLFDLATTNRFNSAAMLGCYVSLGAAVLEDEFAPEFRQLAKQIIDGTLPFRAKVLKCYARFADVWLRYAESDVERESIVKTLLEAIPQEVSEFGQSAIDTEVHLHADLGLVSLPNTLAELLDRCTGAEVPQISFPMRPRPPKHHVPKEYLTPVNPKHLTSEHYGDALKPKITRAHPYASRLTNIVVSEDGKYIKYAQSVLNAMLAAFRLDTNRLNLHDSILALLALVQPEMQPTEFSKYIDIVFQTLDNETTNEDTIANEKQMSDLFSDCFSLLEGLDAPKSSTIERAINVYLFLYNFSTRKLLEVDKFVCYCITMWPNTANGSIRFSKLAHWLLIQIKQAKSLDQMAPFLKTFATIGVFYGIQFVLNLFNYEEFEETSPKDYLERTIPYYRALYEAGIKGSITMDALELKYLRNFLIVYAIYHVNDDLLEGISMLCKVSANDAEVLLSAIASELFDTGVPELNQFLRGLDLKGLCKELLLTLGELLNLSLGLRSRLNFRHDDIEDEAPK